MARTAGQFCSRESMYPPPITAMNPDPTPPVDAKQDSDMTWQQRQQFAQAKSHAKQVKAAPSPLRGSVPQEGEPLIETDTHGRATLHDRPRNNCKNKRSRKHNKMRDVSDPAYIPPHMRNRANDTKAQVKRLDHVPPHLRKGANPAEAQANKSNTAAANANASSATSALSKVKQANKLDSSSNVVSIASKAPPSPPSTSCEPNVLSEKQDSAAKSHPVSNPPKPDPAHGHSKNDGVDWAGWDTPTSNPRPVAPRKDNSRWPRTRAAPYKKHVWIKSSDIKPQPSLTSDDGGVPCKSNSHGDPDYDVKKLVDWNGDWLPPPEQWSARRGHTARNFGASIEQWINGHPNICLEPIPVRDDKLEFLPTEGECKEVVPRYWIVTKVDQASLGAFWKSMPNRRPAALSDISTRPPFWERYVDGRSYYIDGLSGPDALVDKNDPDNVHPRADLLVSVEVRIQLMLEHKAKTERRILAKQRRPIRESVRPADPVPDKGIRPKSNVYFRPVQPADVAGIAQIYNYYVEETIYANEFETRSDRQIADRIDVTIKAGLPYLVAVARGNRLRDSQVAAYVSEKIVGYVCLDEYCHQASMYRYTFKMELFVHPGYVCQNIGSCLLDRVLEMTNTGYSAYGGYEYRNDFEYLKNGPSRVIKTMILTVLKEKEESEKATTKFLKRFKFNRSGHVPNIGYKMGKVIDAHFYRHTTTESIDPSSRPTVSLDHD